MARVDRFFHTRVELGMAVDGGEDDFVEAGRIAALATQSLHDEIDTFPKPGLVSHVDSGSHGDMDAALMHRSAVVIAPYFVRLATAGSSGAGMSELRAIGIEAEQAMLDATGGVNSHRGAIFGMGLLVAAAGAKIRFHRDETLGEIVARRWGAEIMAGGIMACSHGSIVGRRYGVGGARAEAAAGFPTIYGVALPAFQEAYQFAAPSAEAIRVHVCFALIQRLADTNLLHRGGAAGLSFAQNEASRFLVEGSIGHPDWRVRARQIHEAFVTRRLSPGGAADLLSMALFIRAHTCRRLTLVTDAVEDLPC